MDSDTFLSDDGSLTTNGLTNIALENKSMQTNQRKISTWKQQLEELQKAYDNGYITEENFLSKSKEITSNINQAAKDVNSSQQNLINMYISQMEKENEYLQDNISKRKEALEAKKDYYDYDKNIKSKTKDINAIRAQIAALSGTTNAVAKAKLEQLKADLADKQDDLKDTKYNHKMDMQSKGYDELGNQADNALDTATQAVKTNTDMQKSVISNMLKEVQKNYKDVYSNITNIVKDSGAQISSEFEKMLKNIGNGKGGFKVTITSDAKPAAKKSNIFNKQAPGSTGREKNNKKTNKKVKQVNKDGSSANAAKDENGTNRYALQKITATPKSITMGVGKGAFVKIGFFPEKTTYKTFTYEVSKKGIISIQKGTAALNIKALKSGTTVITIKGYGAGKTAKVTVKVVKDGAKRTNIAKNVAKSLNATLKTSDVTKILNATAGKSDSDVQKYTQEYIQKQKSDVAKWFNALPAFKGNASKITDPIVKHLAQKGKKATVSDIKKAASLLGYGSNEYKDISKWNKSQKNALINKLKGYGFSNGGVIRNLIPASMGTLLGDAIMKNGDTGFIGVKPGETVLTQDFTKLLKPTTAIMQDFTDVMKKAGTPSVKEIPARQEVTMNNDYQFIVNGVDMGRKPC